MRTRNAPQKYVATSTFLLLAACCGTALASNDVQPCPELSARTDAVLSEIIETELVDLPVLVDTTGEPAAEDVEQAAEKEDASLRRTESQGVRTHLPGVSEADLPRFRRQMNRSDI